MLNLHLRSSRSAATNTHASGIDRSVSNTCENSIHQVDEYDVLRQLQDIVAVFGYCDLERRIIAGLIMNGVELGFACIRQAAQPAICGVDIEVPEAVAIPVVAPALRQ